MDMNLIPLLFPIGMLVPVVLFLYTQQNILKSIHPENRNIKPGEVWLQLIPVYGLVWQYVVVTRIALSIRNEIEFRSATFSFEATGSYENNYLPKPTFSIGIIYCIFVNLSILPKISMIAATAAFICWIIYWMKLNDYKNLFQLKAI